MDMTAAWRAFASALPSPEPNDASTRPADVSASAWASYVNEVVRPLAELVRILRPRIVGISGPPGSGKSTLARLVGTAVKPDALALSLDDFYLPLDERRRRGMAWRGPPGSHDLPLLIDVLDRIRDRRAPILVPRFSADIDDHIDPLRLEAVPELVFLDGWFLGYTDDGYGDIRRYLDLLVFLDITADEARKRRFEREASLRREGGGFSETDMQRFWGEVLGPGMRRWTRPARDSADFVLSIDPTQRLRAVEVSDRRVIQALTTG